MFRRPTPFPPSIITIVVATLTCLGVRRSDLFFWGFRIVHSPHDLDFACWSNPLKVAARPVGGVTTPKTTGQREPTMRTGACLIPRTPAGPPGTPPTGSDRDVPVSVSATADDGKDAGANNTEAFSAPRSATTIATGGGVLLYYWPRRLAASAGRVQPILNGRPTC